MSVTFRQGKQIQALRGRNLGYRAIAAQMGINRDTVRNYCVAHQLSRVHAGTASKPPKACLCCGAELVQPSRGRKRKFCSDACCRKWWSENPQAIRQSPEALYESTCLNCGKVFTAYGRPTPTKSRGFCISWAAGRSTTVMPMVRCAFPVTECRKPTFVLPIRQHRLPDSCCRCSL